MTWLVRASDQETAEQRTKRSVARFGVQTGSRLPRNWKVLPGDLLSHDWRDAPELRGTIDAPGGEHLLRQQRRHPEDQRGGSARGGAGDAPAAGGSLRVLRVVSTLLIVLGVGGPYLTSVEG